MSEKERHQLLDWIKAYFHVAVGRMMSNNGDDDAMAFMNQFLIELARLSVNKRNSRRRKTACRCLLSHKTVEHNFIRLLLAGKSFRRNLYRPSLGSRRDERFSASSLSFGFCLACRKLKLPQETFSQLDH